MKTRNENDPQNESVPCCTPINQTTTHRILCCEIDSTSHSAEHHSNCCDKDSMAVQKVRQSTGCC